MKKTLLTLAIAALGCTAFGASAQPQDNAPRMQNKMYQPQKFTDFAFEGILLDLNQQQRMDSLNAAVKDFQAQQQDYTTVNLPDNQGLTNKQGAKPDKAKSGKKDKKKDEKKGKHAQEFIRSKVGQRGMLPAPYGPDYISKVKEILTPEQYTTFLENIVLMPYNQQAQGAQQAPGR